MTSPRRGRGRPRKEDQNGTGGFSGQNLTDAFRFIGQEDGGPSLYEGIADLLRPGKSIYELVANSRLTPAQGDAIHSLMERGLARLTNAEKTKLAENKLDYSEMPYPLRMVATFCMVRISVGGLGRSQITSAITGIMMGTSDPDADDGKASAPEPPPPPPPVGSS